MILVSWIYLIVSSIALGRPVPVIDRTRSSRNSGTRTSRILLFSIIQESATVKKEKRTDAATCESSISVGLLGFYPF